MTTNGSSTAAVDGPTVDVEPAESRRARTGVRKGYSRFRVLTACGLALGCFAAVTFAILGREDGSCATTQENLLADDHEWVVAGDPSVIARRQDALVIQPRTTAPDDATTTMDLDLAGAPVRYCRVELEWTLLSGGSTPHGAQFIMIEESGREHRVMLGPQPSGPGAGLDLWVCEKDACQAHREFAHPFVPPKRVGKRVVVAVEWADGSYAMSVDGRAVTSVPAPGPIAGLRFLTVSSDPAAWVVEASRLTASAARSG
jgi:hypothetical protein